MNENIIFKLNDKELIEILIPQTLDLLFRYDEVTILFHSSHNTLTIFDNDFIIYALWMLQGSLENVLKNKAKLDPSITRNIGYFWNKYLWLEDEDLKNENLKYIKGTEDQKRWVGRNFIVWSHKEITTWLYEKDEKIILEITPTYDWNIDLTEEENQPFYQVFLANYKPYVITEIDREVVEDWYKKTDELLHIVEANDELYKCDCAQECKYENTRSDVLINNSEL